MTEKQYVEFLKEHEEAYEDSVDMEDYLEEVSGQWKGSYTGQLFAAIKKDEEARRIADYQNKVSQRVEYLKDSYREMLS